MSKRLFSRKCASPARRSVCGYNEKMFTWVKCLWSQKVNWNFSMFLFSATPRLCVAFTFYPVFHISTWNYISKIIMLFIVSAAQIYLMVVIELGSKSLFLQEKKSCSCISVLPRFQEYILDCVKVLHLKFVKQHEIPFTTLCYRVSRYWHLSEIGSFPFKSA